MKSDNLPNCLLILGCGYVGTKLAAACLKLGIQVKATTRNTAAVSGLQALGADVVYNDTPSDLPTQWLQLCEAVLDSIPLSYHDKRIPQQSQSLWLAPLLTKLPNMTWAGYLSATSVYPDSQGAWVDETTPPNTNSLRGKERIMAEQAWLKHVKHAEVFRLAGIYGNDRNILGKIQAGNYTTVAWQPQHYSNRIHVDDIVSALIAAMRAPSPQRIVNLSDDAPCSHADYACQLAAFIQAPQPIILSPKQAETQLSASFLDFFRDNKRISNRKMHQELLSDLRYPSFKAALQSLSIGNTT